MITSNLKGVIARLETLQAGLPGCVDRALAAEYWGPVLRSVAEKTLRVQFALIEDLQARTRMERLLPKILDLVSVVVRPGSAVFKLSLPAEAVDGVSLGAAANYAGLSWTPSGRARKWALPDAEAQANLEASRQAVLDWVTLEKQRDERDANLSNEQIAERIEVILGLRPAMVQRNQAMEEAAESLRGAIEAWLAGESETPSGGHAIETPSTSPGRATGRPSGIGKDQARQWLDAVLQTWVVFFRAHVKDRVSAEIHKLHERLKARQPELI